MGNGPSRIEDDHQEVLDNNNPAEENSEHKDYKDQDLNEEDQAKIKERTEKTIERVLQKAHADISDTLDGTVWDEWDQENNKQEQNDALNPLNISDLPNLLCDEEITIKKSSRRKTISYFETQEDKITQPKQQENQEKTKLKKQKKEEVNEVEETFTPRRSARRQTIANFETVPTEMDTDVTPLKPTRRNNKKATVVNEKSTDECENNENIENIENAHPNQMSSVKTRNTKKQPTTENEEKVAEKPKRKRGRPSLSERQKNIPLTQAFEELAIGVKSQKGIDNTEENLRRTPRKQGVQPTEVDQEVDTPSRYSLRNQDRRKTMY